VSAGGERERPAEGKNQEKGVFVMRKEPLQNKDYDLISVIYHASQGYETCDQYCKDAEREGDRDAVQFFNEVREQNQRLVEKGKQLLKSRLS
jgi:hypothetical protein